MSDSERAAALAAVDRDLAALTDSAERLQELGEPWAGAIVQAVARVKFERNWFAKERERRAADAVERAKEQR